MSRNWHHGGEQHDANYSIQYTDADSTESRPLLDSQARASRFHGLVWIVFLTILFGVGTGIGFYLLWEEGPHWYQVAPLYFIPRETWGAKEPLVTPETHITEFTEVEITSTETNSCKTALKCSETVRKIQEEHMNSLNQSDIAFNFVIAGDGRCYEGRGWRTRPGFGAKNDSLLIAFLGNFRFTQPNVNQFQQAKALIQEAVDQKVLDNCFRMSLFKQPQGEMMNVFKKLLKEVNKDRSGLNCSSIKK